MKKLAEFITKHKNIIILLAVILLIPSGIGYVSTRVNYDILSYLPDSLETVKGQDVMVDEFGMGAFSMIVVEDMSMKDAAALEKKIEAIDHVEDVLWYDDALDISVPTKMMPDKLRKAFFNGDATMMIALFDNTTSADDTMDAIANIRKTVGKSAFAAGMSGCRYRHQGSGAQGNAGIRYDRSSSGACGAADHDGVVCDTVNFPGDDRYVDRV